MLSLSLLHAVSVLFRLTKVFHLQSVQERTKKAENQNKSAVNKSIKAIKKKKLQRKKNNNKGGNNSVYWDSDSVCLQQHHTAPYSSQAPKAPLSYFLRPLHSRLTVLKTFDKSKHFNLNHRCSLCLPRNSHGSIRGKHSNLPRTECPFMLYIVSC